ncbi:4-alpha-glucanotransferase [Luteimicrobium subarcticum]|uniref:4-alpha-glucanotransferase n=1 Tax=Luteimicrobium subarcticum TaxID=620910 RepID=UPI000C24C20D|nr:4-alpha-glucanotransferase [Luteimicrobium subarcticum]
MERKRPRTGDDGALRELAEAYGVAAEYWDFFGARVQVEEDTLVAVLESLGVPASTPDLVRIHLAHRLDAPWRRMLPPTVVARAGAGTTFPVHVEHGDPVDVWIELEGGGTVAAHQVDRVVEPRTVDGRLLGEATFAVPDDVGLGWHTLHASSGNRTSHAVLAVTPAHLRLPRALRKGARAWGLMAQLYSVRSRQSWGVGDLTDLGDLAWLAARRSGADFLLVNPLHAAEPRAPLTPSPYLPTTRRFVSPLYVRVEDVRETAYLSAADRSLVEWAFDTVRDLDTDPGPIDRDAAWTAKRSALEVVFAHPRSTARQAALDAFREREGQGLEDFALWCALVDHFGGTRDWPDEAFDLTSPLVAELRTELADGVDFHVWLQWVADEQLERAQRAALDAGMSVGIVHDLAVGVHPEGADRWAQRQVLANGVGVGAPPDMYNQQGQNWSQPPWNPVELPRVGYAPYRDMLRTVLRHAGGIRIDHILGLFRLWFVPDGMTPDRGTYVRFDHEALVGILCLEAERAGAVVIGEDLGTVEPWIRDYLADRGVLGTSILWFEQRDGAPLPPEAYRRLALTTVTTHDLPPTPAYLAGEHVELRERLGLLTEDPEVVRRDARREREAVLRALRDRGLLGEDASEREVVEALHAFVAATPSLLVGVSLADATGERRAQNQPGTDQEYPNWKVPLGDGTGEPVLLDDLFGSVRLQSLLAVVDGAVHHRAP